MVRKFSFCTCVPVLHVQVFYWTCTYSYLLLKIMCSHIFIVCHLLPFLYVLMYLFFWFFLSTSLSFVQVFYWTHFLYLLFWLLVILHAPNFWKWFIGPFCLFVIEKCIRQGTFLYSWTRTFVRLCAFCSAILKFKRP